MLKNTIILQAITLGFDFNQFDKEDTAEEIRQNIFDFCCNKIEQLPIIEDECEVTNNGRTQHVEHGNYSCSGEIVHFSDNWQKQPDTKVFHSSYMVEDEGIFKQMKLFYLVGQTDYNAPDGYYFDKKTKQHVKYI